MLQLIRSKYEHIFNFTIYGERHSGTNFLEQCIRLQFGLDITYYHGFKHWFGFTKPESISCDRHTLFIGIVRNPYDWILAFYNAPHHVPIQNAIKLENFLQNEWYSVDFHNKEILRDRNYSTLPDLKRYKNIFELRKQKSIYLSQIMPIISSNYILFSYDAFLYNHYTYLDLIGQRFDLKTIGKAPEVFMKPTTELSPKIKDIIDSNIDWSVENSIGFFKR